MFATSRTLKGLALSGHAPGIFKHTSKSGVPVNQIFVSIFFGCIAFVSVLPGGKALLEFLLSLVGMQAMITYCCICLIHIRFRKACEYQDVKVNGFPYITPYFPYGQYFTIGCLLLMMILMGAVPGIQRKASATDLLVIYSGIPVFLIPFIGYKLIKKTRLVELRDCDLITGRS